MDICVGIGSLYLIIISVFAKKIILTVIQFVLTVQTGQSLLHVSFVQNKTNFYFIIDYNSIIQYKDE